MPDFFDSHRAPDDGTGEWSEAFAALPLETPPGDGWLRIAHAMDASTRPRRRVRHERRTTWAIGLASAAVLVMAAWSPLSHWLQGTRNPPASTPAVAIKASSSRSVVAASQVPLDAEPHSEASTIVGTAAQAVPASHGERSSGAAGVARSAPHARKAAQTATRNVTPSARTGLQQVATATPENIAATPAASETSPAGLQNLQAQSARLEALVAIARDERVGNASSELLSAELDAGIAAVDASLSHDDLDDSRRRELWQQRVDLLQQLAGVETTARWLAAQGISNETALVSVD